MKYKGSRRELNRNFAPRLLESGLLGSIRRVRRHVTQRDLNLMERLRVVACDSRLAASEEFSHPPLESIAPGIPHLLAGPICQPRISARYGM